MKNILSIRKEVKNPEIFDITIDNISQLLKYNSVESTFFFYPFDLTTTAKSFTIQPFDEYVANISCSQQSTYRKIRFFGKNFFGLILGLIIFIIFALIKPDDLVSVQSVVSIFGAYTVGKEMWDDIDSILSTITRALPVRWISQKYHYLREEYGTIRQFWEKARIHRYQKSSILPLKMDFIKHSNSKTVVLFFTKRSLKNSNKETARIASIIIKPEYISKIREKGFMFGVKIMLTKTFLFFNYDVELFQAMTTDGKLKIGTVDSSYIWHEKTILLRKILRIGRLKLYLSKENRKEELIISSK
ncbi:hypothetical protein JW887_02230 [Candidatus Dojkabacteria bacterium]|nr:hypothetical protein [Candidatus Dojkabacteria bacterium]